MEPSIDLLSLPVPSCNARRFYGDDPNQFGELRIPRSEGPWPVVVGVHGGWWRAEHDLQSHAHLCAALTEDGFATWNVEYRRTGQPGGGFPGTFNDVVLSVEFLAHLAHEFPLDLRRVVIVGFSAGGHLAALCAAEKFDAVTLTGIVSLAGAVDLGLCDELELSGGVVRSFLGGAQAEIPDTYRRACPTLRLPARVPVHLIHGTHDASVPVEVSRSYRDAADRAQSPCTLAELPGRQHFELIDPRAECWGRVEGVVRTALNSGTHGHDPAHT